MTKELLVTLFAGIGIFGSINLVFWVIFGLIEKRAG